MNDCAYWLKRFKEISLYEEMLVQNVERIKREEGVLSARDFADDISTRIKTIQRLIDQEGRGK